MFELLYQYLIQHGTLSLPGLGTLTLRRIPAMSDFSNQRMVAPYDRFYFDPHSDAPHKSLFVYLAGTRKIDEWEAIKAVNDFSYDLKQQLKGGQPVRWDGIGTLRAGVTGEIDLEGESLEYHFLSPAPAKRVVRVNAHHLIRRGDVEVSGSFLEGSEVYPGTEETVRARVSWWVWALIIGAVALIVLFIHFYTNGFSGNSLQNQQKIQSKAPEKTYRSS